MVGAVSAPYQDRLDDRPSMRAMRHIPADNDCLAVDVGIGPATRAVGPVTSHNRLLVDDIGVVGCMDSPARAARRVTPDHCLLVDELIVGAVMMVTMTVAVVTVVAAVAMADVMMVMVVVVMSGLRFLVEIDHGDALPHNHGVRRWPPDDYRWLGS